MGFMKFYGRWFDDGVLGGRKRRRLWEPMVCCTLGTLLIRKKGGIRSVCSSNLYTIES